MKYSININQLALAKTSLDITEAAILDYLIFICSSVNEKIEQQRVKDEKGIWTWVSFSAILEGLPLLRLNNKNSISHRIRKIYEEGFIDYMRVNNKKVYVRLTAKVDELIIMTNVLGTPEVSAVEQSITLETQNCHSTVTDNNNNIISKPAAKKRENIGNTIPLIDQELTPEQLYKVSLLKQVWCPTIVKKYYNIRDIIERGEFNPKWGKDLYLILCKWVKMDIDRGKISTMDEMQVELNKQWHDPKRIQGVHMFEKALIARKEGKI